MNRSDKIQLKLTKIDPSKKYDKHYNDTQDFDINAVKNTQTNLWTIRYPTAYVTPVPLQIQFTSFPKLIDYVHVYLTKRNLKIKEIIDVR